MNMPNVVMDRPGGESSPKKDLKNLFSGGTNQRISKKLPVKPLPAHTLNSYNSIKQQQEAIKRLSK